MEVVKVGKGDLLFAVFPGDDAVSLMFKPGIMREGYTGFSYDFDEDAGRIDIDVKHPEKPYRVTFSLGQEDAILREQLVSLRKVAIVRKLAMSK